jgi:hypothetical protein
MSNRQPRRIIYVVGISFIIITSIILLIPYFNFPSSEPTTPSLDISTKTNLIPNPGFELGNYDVSSLPSQWYYDEGNADFEWVDDTTQSHSGAKSIQLSNAWNEDDPDERPRIYTELTLPTAENIENRRFLFHFWTKTDNVDVGFVWAVIRYRAGSTTLAYDLFRFLNSTDWNSNDFILETIPTGTTGFRIELQLDNSPGTVWFDDLFLVELNSTEYQIVSRLERFTPSNWSGTTPTGTPGDTTHLEQINGAWWLVNATGHCFWSVGVSSDGVDPTSNPYLWENLGSPSQSGIDAYRGECRVRLKEDLNCNTNYRDTVSGPTRNYISWMNFGTELTVGGSTPVWVLRDHTGNTFGGNGAHQFPDPFDSDWQDTVYQIAYDGMPEWFLSRPDVLGYWTDNEMEYGPLYKYIYGEACGNAFVEWLQGNLTNLAPRAELPPNQVYNEISELNSAWSSTLHTYSYSSWDDVVSGVDPVRIRGWEDTNVMEDMYAFEREIYRAYCHHVINAIRTAEEAHDTSQKLIISNRIAYAGPCYYTICLKRVMDLFSDFDIIGLNLYPDYNRMRTYYEYEYLKDLEDTFVKRTNRPFIVAEYGLAAVDSNVPVARWRPKTVDTQVQRGIGYRNLVNQLFHMPYSLGMHWFTWANAYFSGGYSDPRNSGVIDDFDNYYTEFTTYMTATNAYVGMSGRSGSNSYDNFYWDSLQVTIIDGT